MSRIPIVHTANRSNPPFHSSSRSDISIVNFPPDNPSIAFVHIAGQSGTPPFNWNSRYSTKLLDQAKYALANLGECLTIAGATPRDVTKITIHTVDLGTQSGDLIKLLTEFFTDREGNVHKPPRTMREVASGPRIEIDAEAVVSLAAPPSYEKVTGSA
ncbi:hypothetical protein BDW59DRAFT_151321 [Aspergillus cavernicola]|uniref:Uncharacterized protein n=1 Tax=Aspergillus cavernicola TaxID=176166 RepID=A0ABR4HX50_9EURO